MNWNNETPPAGFLLWIRGGYRRLETHIAEDPAISDHAILPLTEEECHCFLVGQGTADARALWANFNRGSLMTVPAVEWNDDGSSTFTLVGTEADVQAAVEEVPEGIPVDVEESAAGRSAPRASAASYRTDSARRSRRPCQTVTTTLPSMRRPDGRGGDGVCALDRRGAPPAGGGEGDDLALRRVTVGGAGTSGCRGSHSGPASRPKRRRSPGPRAGYSRSRF